MEAGFDYDCILIGSGLGALLCAAVLSKEGKRVLVLEKNEQIGGSLQTFQRNGITYDTGVHYIGALDKGQTLHQIFNYVGILDRLELQQLDGSAFDTILFGDDETAYPMAQGYDGFIDGLSAQFPTQRDNLKQLCAEMKRTCAKFPLYQMMADEQIDDLEILQQPLRKTLEQFITDPKLIQVLAGNNLLYAGCGEETPFYVYALILNSFIESSWRCTAGGDQIAKLLARVIKANGGSIIRNAAVVKMVEENELLKYVELSNGKRFSAAQYISNLHPQTTLELLESDFIRPAFRSRIRKLKNTPGSFVVYAELEPGKVSYTNRNYYYFDGPDVWKGGNYEITQWPYQFGLFEMPPVSGDFTQAVSIMTYMRWEEVEEWENSFNVSEMAGGRGAAYEEFKQEKAKLLLEKVKKKFPDLVANIRSFAVSTPLTYRDFLNYPEGGMYGIKKDFNEPVKTMISPNTRISNLFFTGQNIKLHGILGVAISAMVTCNVMLGKEYLMEKLTIKPVKPHS
ncbi:MAG: NAD(P)/FAD-dependent oxidoreductase [Chitinophagales bacterium]